MLKKIRIALAWVFWIGITLLLLDWGGLLHGYLGWMAKIQFLPAVLALNVGTIIGLVLLTLVFGRVYCSIICPLGLFQDGIAWIRAHRSKKPYEYHKEVKWLRYGVWVLFVVALIAGVQVLVAILAPYSAYGRMVAGLTGRIHSLPALLIALGTLLFLAFIAFRWGRAYCNGVCPVGTTLSFFSRFAMFRPMIDADKCVRCRSCELHCKARCISITKEDVHIDHSRCVDCFNCIDNCPAGGLKYRFTWKAGAHGAGASPEAFARIGSRSDASGDAPAPGRRAFLAGTAVALGAAALKGASAKAQTVAKLDGGLAEVLPKQAPEREVPLTPPGSVSVKDFYRRCTACQLCITHCPNKVLRPSADLEHLMQPEMGYEDGFCRPECTRCSELCPTGAIHRITREEKTQYHIGTARVNPELCLVATGKSHCGKCVQACPSGAVKLVNTEDGHRIPVVAEEICTGCGACEYLCPIRPISAITVNGRYEHEA